MIPFDPERSRLLVAPPTDGPGSWAGAPSAFRDGSDLYVVYRLRQPEPIRGYELRVAAVIGDRVEDILRIRKHAFGGESVERSGLVRAGDMWRLYVGYVSVEDHAWRIGLIESRSIDALDARSIRTVLHPADADLAAAKDPWLIREGGRWLMFVSCGRAVPDARFHARGDALSTGAVRSETGLATSEDGVSWSWDGIVFPAIGTGWDRFTSRLTCAAQTGDGWIGCYDGSASLAENYEERCGVARSPDLRHWERVSNDGPSIGTARGPGGVRYVATAPSGEVFFEHTREDGAHELRAILT